MENQEAKNEALIGGSELNAGLGSVVCECRQCLRDRGEGEIVFGGFVAAEEMRMVLCKKCGNKRCPHATNHRLGCTNSNDPGQAGSTYENYKPPNVI